MRNAMWVGGGITGMGEIPMLGVKEKGFAKVIRDIFRNGEKGFFYDPSDLPTMFQDAAGTVPVTAVGQPVGLVLDKSKGLLLGKEKAVNGTNPTELTNWSIGVVGSNDLTVVNGRVRATRTGLANPSAALELKDLVVGTLYKASIDVYRGTSSVPQIIVRTSTSDSLTPILNSITVDQVYQKVEFLFKASATTMFIGAVVSLPAIGEYFEVANVSVKKILGNHAYQTTSASRPILRKNDITGANYLEFDGSDDFLQTADIDFTSTDKLSLFAGVRKQSKSLAMLCELSSTSSASFQANAFYLAVPETINGTVYFRSRATSIGSQIAKGGTGNAPRNCVITAKSDIPNDLNTVSIDGVLGEPTSDDLGIGNLGNYPLYIGRRGGMQFPFNGHIYGLIGIGKLASDDETVTIEKELAKRVGVTLNV